MGQPKKIRSIQVTLDDANGTVLVFGPHEMAPGSHYSISRNFTRPPRKRGKNEPKVEVETWLSHEIHFTTNREPQKTWEERTLLT